MFFIVSTMALGTVFLGVKATARKPTEALGRLVVEAKAEANLLSASSSRE